jgi:hypothetical protein
MKVETAQEYRQRVARAGGLGRAKSLSPKERKKAASKAVRARWAKDKAMKKFVQTRPQISTPHEGDGEVPPAEGRARRAKVKKEKT